MKLKCLLLFVFALGFTSFVSAQGNEGTIVNSSTPLKESAAVNVNPMNRLVLENYLNAESKVNDPMRFVYLTAAANALGALNNEVKSDQAMLGVHVRATDETLRQQLQINGNFGLVVEHVVEQSAAEKFELRKHDVLHKLDGQLLANSEQFQALIDSYKPGDKVAVALFRGGKLVELEVELSEKKYNSISLKNLEDYHKSLLDNANPHAKSWQIHDCKTCHAVDSLTTAKKLPTVGQPLPTLIRSQLYPKYELNSGSEAKADK